MKLIVCDLDETLLDSNKQISKENLNAIYEAQEKGHKFIVATGRGYTYIDSILDELHVLNKKNEYVISNNGAIVTENEGPKQLYFCGLNNEVALKLIHFAFERNICVQVFLVKDVYAYNVGDDEKDVLLSYKKDAIICNHHDIEFLKSENIVKVMFQSLDMNYLMSLEDIIDFKDDLNISYSSHRYMEFTTKGVNKKEALKFLLNHLNMKLDDVIAIGDNYNDLEMLEYAGIGCAVNNALDAIKEKCNYVSEYSNNESAVADIINRFVLNNYEKIK